MKSLNEIRDELASRYDWVEYNRFTDGFDAGVKAERERSQILVEAISKYTEYSYSAILDEALDQYNKGQQDV